jgi:hypothetical protein
MHSSNFGKLEFLLPLDFTYPYSIFYKGNTVAISFWELRWLTVGAVLNSDTP